MIFHFHKRFFNTAESEAADLLESVAVLSGIPEKRSRGTPYGRISQDFMVLATLPELALHVLNAGVLVRP